MFLAAAGWLVVRYGMGELRDPGTLLGLYGRWAALGGAVWIVAVVGGVVATALMRHRASPAAGPRTFSFGVAIALVVADVALLLTGQISVTLALWGVAGTVLVATAAYLLYRYPAAAARDFA